MTAPAPPEIDETPETEAATKAAVFAAAERLFALHGFQNVSVRDITAEARVDLASVNYHFGSKDALLFEIFRRRTSELNRERARMLHEASDRAGGKPTVRAILEALLAPPLKWADPANDRRISVQFIIRARSEGTEQMRDVLQNDVSHLARFADALKAARPDLPLAWRADIVMLMRRCPQPIIALVQGAATGGGFALALAADIRIATRSARMNCAFLKLGLGGCDIGTSYFLPRLVGVSVASELILTGSFINAERALAVGLVSEVVEEGGLEAAAAPYVEAMMTASPVGLRLSKECLNISVDAGSIEAVIAMEDRN